MRTTDLVEVFILGKREKEEKKKKKLPMASFDRINQPAYSF